MDIHQSCRVGTKIRLPVFEFIIIDTGFQCFFIQPVCRKLLQSLLDDGYKLILPVLIGIFGNDTEIRLTHTIVIKTVNFFADSGIGKRFFQRSSRCRAKHIIENLKSDVL